MSPFVVGYFDATTNKLDKEIFEEVRTPSSFIHDRLNDILPFTSLFVCSFVRSFICSFVSLLVRLFLCLSVCLFVFCPVVCLFLNIFDKLGNKCLHTRS